MKIKKLTYYDKAYDWKLETTEFSDLTLLVGVSGVGKTKILESILRLKDIGDGHPANGVQWAVEFLAVNGDEYIWQGEYENIAKPGEVETIRAFQREGFIIPSIISEKLIRNGLVVVERKGTEIWLRGQLTPKLPPFQSVISILNQEDEIGFAYYSFKRIVRSGAIELGRFVGYDMRLPEFIEMLKAKPNYETIKECDLSSHLKAALVYQCVPELFLQIKERFIEVFPQVEDVQMELQSIVALPVDADDYYPMLQIKESGVSHWIPQDKISSGMYKTFMHFCEMFLWPDGTVVLIDEFENSLGVNCLDVLTEDLLQENRRLQFIVTSHHPYIINNISPKYWKIVRRQGGRVFTEDAAALRLGSSRQEAFTQLLNHEHFLEGVIAA